MQVYSEGADVLSLGIRRTLLAYRLNLIDAITLSVVVPGSKTLLVGMAVFSEEH